MTNADKIRSMTNDELAEFLMCVETNSVSGVTYINGIDSSALDGKNDFVRWLMEETVL